jgi:hypothetical protein
MSTTKVDAASVPALSSIHDTGAFKNRLPNINTPERLYTKAQRNAWNVIKIDNTIKKQNKG